MSPGAPSCGESWSQNEGERKAEPGCAGVPLRARLIPPTPVCPAFPSLEQESVSFLVREGRLTGTKSLTSI